MNKGGGLTYFLSIMYNALLHSLRQFSHLCTAPLDSLPCDLAEKGVTKMVKVRQNSQLTTPIISMLAVYKVYIFKLGLQPFQK